MPPPSTPSPPSPDGSLPFDETGESLGPATTLDDFERTRLRALGAAVHFSPDRATCKLAQRRILGEPFNVSLTFTSSAAGNHLHTIDLFPNRPADAKGWDSWTLESELARKAWAEVWAATVFGKPLTIKPITLPELPAPVFPANPAPEHPRHALFDWGEVCSYFDSKAGFAGLWITYTNAAPPVQPVQPTAAR